MTGFATLSGGDTISFNLSTSQIAAVQSAITAMNAGYTSDTLFTTLNQAPTNPTSENVFNLDGGTNMDFAGGYTNAVFLDSVNSFMATNLGSANVNNVLVVGNEGNDSISLDEAATVYAGGGVDTIYVNSWNHGGGTAGISVGNGNDSLTLVGNGALQAGGGQDTVDVENSTYAGTNTITLGNGNDAVTVNSGYATLTAGSGNDTINFNAYGQINLGQGHDTINLGSDLQVTINAAGHATVYGAASGEESVTAGGNVSVVAGTSSYDNFTATTGNVTLDGGANSGNDTFFAGSGTTSMIGGTGIDYFNGGTGNATMDGGSYFNYFFGSAGNNVMVAGNGINDFFGGSGNDTMIATSSTVPSGYNQNFFNFDGTLGGNHVIQGYSSNSTIFGLNFTNYGTLTPDQILADSSVVGGNLVISIPGGGGVQATTITIKGVTAMSDWQIHTS